MKFFPKKVRKILHREGNCKGLCSPNTEIDGFEKKDIKKIFKSSQEIEAQGQSMDVM